MNQEIQQIIEMVNELWYYHKSNEILSYIQLPIEILFIIAMYKVNQVLKTYIQENEKFL